MLYPIINLGSKTQDSGPKFECHKHGGLKCKFIHTQRLGKKFANILEQAENTAKVMIRRKDGRAFALIPEKIAFSPLDVPSIHAKIISHEIADMVREGRERRMER